MSIGKRIVERLDELDMTQKQLAELLQIPYRTLNGYVRTSREPDYETLKNIAKTLHVTCDYLLDFEPIDLRTVKTKELALIKEIRVLTADKQELMFEMIKVMKKQSNK